MPDPKALLAWARQTAAKMKADGVPEADIDRFMQEEVQLSLEQVTSPDVDDYLRAGGMGATFGFLDELAGAGAAIVPGGKGYSEARDEVRRNYEAANEAATGLDQAKLSGAEVLGGIGSSLLGAGAAGLAAKGLGMGAKAAQATGTAAKAYRGAKAGAAAGGAAGAGYSDELTPGAVLGGAAAGAVTGGALPVIGAAGKGLARYVGDMVKPGRAVQREASAQLPFIQGGAQQVMDRLESLAPGTPVQGALSPEMIALTRGVGADVAAGTQARQVAAARIPEIQNAFNRLSAQYEQTLNGVRVQAPSEVLDVLEKNLKGAGRASFAPNGEVDATLVQTIRTKLREKIQTTKKGSVKKELGPDRRVLDNFMRSIPGVAELDSNWGFLTEHMGLAKKLLQEIKTSTTGHSASRAYGLEAGSVGGNLPAGPRGTAAAALDLLKPNKADRAREARRLLLTPNLPPLLGAVAGEQAGAQWPGLLSGWAAGRGSGLLFSE